MKPNLIKDFFKIGAMAAGGGPLVLALIYWILSAAGQIRVLSVSEVVLGITTSALLAFLAGGISVIYRIETLPLMWATLLHAAILYLDYLLIYLVNGWLKQSLPSVLVFTVLFLVGYLLLWCLISRSIQRSVQRMNARLREGQAP